MVAHLSHIAHLYSTERSLTFPRMVTIISHDSHSPFPGWSPTFPGMVNHLSQDGYPTFIEWSLAFPWTITHPYRFTQHPLNINQHPYDSHQAFPGWSTTFLKMVTHALSIPRISNLKCIHWNVTHFLKDGRPLRAGRSYSIPRMVTPLSHYDTPFPALSLTIYNKVTHTHLPQQGQSRKLIQSKCK